MKRSKLPAPRAIPLTETGGEGWLLPGKRMREFCRDMGFSETAAERHRKHLLRR